jgi:hypothetical protein
MAQGMHLALGALCIIMAIVLVWIAVPNRDGTHPVWLRVYFLRSVYPIVPMLFIVAAVGLVYTALS